ncbi:nuclear transport factor 2 family protein [Paenibacillus hodogayensis]|uniref:Nuclear transport factor 2 family protein n=1 Tax=Paenibacillus hodogayensis TaxID=279208 RepID=A0ABV5VVD7_9BACL
MGEADITIPVRRQLTAYNDRNIEDFIRCFAEDCIVEDGIGRVLMRGTEEIRPFYGKLFANSPNLRCELVSRTVINDYVVDEERITGRGEQNEIRRAVVVYHLTEGRIDHMRLLR